MHRFSNVSVRIFFFAAHLVFLGSFNECYAKPQSSMALYGKTKHQDNLIHYEHVNPNAPKGGRVNLSVLGTFDSLNPFVIKGVPAAGLTLLYPDLFYVTLMDHSPHEHFSQYAYLAEAVDLADDHLSVTFQLRQDATFHDGSAITAEDVIFSFNTLREKGSPLYTQYYGDVIKAEVLDTYQVKFSFKDATNKELPLLLGHFPIFSKAYYSKNKFKDASIKIPLGNGPYRITDVDAGRSITYERVKNWWGEKLPIAKGRYNFDQVRYIYFRDQEVAFEAFKSHNYDLRVENKIKNWVLNYDFEAVKEGKVHKIETPFVQAGIMQGLVMNTRREIFADSRVRRALALAFDFDWLNDNYFYNKYERTDSYFWGLELASSGLPSEAEKDLLETYKDQVPADLFKLPYTLPKNDGSGQNRQALRQAKALLQQAGWEVVKGVLKNTKTGKIFQFDLLLSNMGMTGMLNAYLKSLKRLGIQAKFRVVDTAQYTSRVEDFDYDMIMNVMAQSPSPGNEQREFWGSYVADSKGSRNYAGIKDPVVDALIEKLIDASDRETIVTVAKALDRVLLWGYYVVPLWGSSKLRMAHWDTLKNTGVFPKYNIDLFAWWVDKD